MTERVGTDGDDEIEITDGDTSADGGDGEDTLVVEMTSPNFPQVTGNETYTITADRIFDELGRIDLSFENFEEIEFTISNPALVTIDASQFVPIEGAATFALAFNILDSVSNITGSAFNDRLFLSGFGHVVDGGDGFDSIVVQHPTPSTNSRFTVEADGDFFVLYQERESGGRTELLRAQNVESIGLLRGSGGTNEIDAANAPNRINFNEGTANDIFVGSAFDDLFNMTVGPNNFSSDSFTGGGGADRYWFGLALSRLGGTTITDFRPDDFIDLNNYGIPTDENVTTFIGRDEFNGVAGEYRFFTNNGRTFVQYDSDGDGTADGTLTIANGEFELERVSRSPLFEHNLFIAGFISGTSADEVFVGTAEGDRFFASTGNDTIDGGSNVDFAHVSGNMADYTVTQTSLGVFEVTGADGTDVLTNVEFLQFDDQTMRLLRGTGVSVNFETADLSVYQDAMNNILDFDGNALGGNGNWLRIGSADVNGDGDIDQILVNDAIGRFATVGTAPDGLVYFDDNSWAGETRVAGIYIDPLVQSGEVEAGSDNDSQRRFQNDLEIENINRVLGSDDYDGDGIWEVYFALTDGTAYLRALMHADGNIRYANYQSEQEVMDYLTANGYDESTFGDWFSAPTSGDTQTFVNEAPTAKEVSEANLAALSSTKAIVDPVESAFGGPAAIQKGIFETLDAEFFG